MPSFADAFTSRHNPRPEGLPAALPCIGLRRLPLVPVTRNLDVVPGAAPSFADRCLPGPNPAPLGAPVGLPGVGPFGLPAEHQIRGVDAPGRELAPADALRRRALSLRHLQLDGIPVYPDLPCLPGRDQVVLRDHAVVLARMQALLLLTGLAQRQYNRTEFDRLVGVFGVQDAFDDHELGFLDQREPDLADSLPFCWGQEAVWTLLWAMQGVPSIGRPTALCDVRRAINVAMGPAALTLIRHTRMRPVDEILGEADRTYRYHWAVHDAQLHQQRMPGGLVPEVVEQRRMALEWLIGRGGPSDHPGAGWIEVDLST